MTHALEAFNAASRDAALATALHFCGSERWAAALVDGRPYDDLGALAAVAGAAWDAVAEDDRLQAFAAHPLIGDREVLRAKYATTAHAEQGQVLTASDATLDALAALNVQYADRHGFIFIVCATGRSAEEMLALLAGRIDNDRATELVNASREQAAITRLRLTQHFDEGV